MIKWGLEMFIVVVSGIMRKVKTPGHQLIMRLIIQTVHCHVVHKCERPMSKHLKEFFKDKGWKLVKYFWEILFFNFVYSIRLNSIRKLIFQNISNFPSLDQFFSFPFLVPIPSHVHQCSLGDSSTLSCLHLFLHIFQVTGLPLKIPHAWH